MSKSLILLLIGIATQLCAQTNLVPNPGFETYSVCPSFYSQLLLVNPWFQPSTGTPDFLHTCASNTLVQIPNSDYGHSYAHSGSGMAGLFVTAGVSALLDKVYREYLGVKLMSPLISGQKYYVSFFVKLSQNYSRYASNQMSMYFTKDSISKAVYDTIKAIPQINNPPYNFIASKTNWTKISGSIVATGLEKYIYIGNFHPDVTNDTLCLCNTAPWTGPRGIYYYIDDICVSTSSAYCSTWTGLSENKLEKAVTVYPNPNSGHLTIEITDFSNIKAILVKNSYGKVIREFFNINSTEFAMDLTAMSSGIYFLEIEVGNNKIHKRIIKD